MGLLRKSLTALIIVGLVLLVIYLVFINQATSRVIFSNRSIPSKIFAIGQYLIMAVLKFLWQILAYLFWSLWNFLAGVWYDLTGYFSPGYDIRSFEELYVLYKRVEHWSGLPWQVFWGIHAEESSLGSNLGTTPVMTVLPANQHPYFLKICRDLRWDPYQIYGSSKGALGPFQFIPETWVRHGVDGNGDGRKDPFTLEDAIYSAANYLVSKGGLENLPKALWHYNQDDRYVRRVLRYLRYQ